MVLCSLFTCHFFIQHQDLILRLDFNGIKEHVFFKKTKWDSILTALPPFVPELRSIDDVSHFDYEDLAPRFVVKSLSSRENGILGKSRNIFLVMTPVRASLDID